MHKEFDDIDFKKKKGAKHLFGTDVEGIVPKEGEIRLLGNRHQQCAYYAIGKFTLILLLKTVI